MSLYVDCIFQPKILAHESTRSAVLMGSIAQNISNQNCLGENLGCMATLSLIVPSLMQLDRENTKAGFSALCGS